MCSTKFCLSWSDHENCIIGSFKTLFRTNSLVDCTIAADGKQVKAHRLILSASSSYFQSIFAEESDKHPIVFLKGVKFEMVLALLDFIYCGKVEVTEDQLEEFLNTAQSLHIKGLTDDIQCAGSENKIYIRKYLPDLSETIEKKNEDDASQMVDCDALSFQEECALIAEPLAVEENLISNTSPSLDHPYCAENAESAHAQFCIVSGLSANSEASSSKCEQMNASDCNEMEKICVTESPIPSNPAEEKSLINFNPVLLKFNSSELGNDVCEKSKSSTIDRSALQAVLATPRPNKVFQKSGTILVSKSSGPYTTGSIPKQKVFSSQRRQAFIVGNKVLAVPRGTILSGSKEWLQPPKPHLDGKLYPCPECNKAFRKPSILANHRRTHTGEKPYQCQECGRMFNQSSNFRRHQRIHIEQRLQKKAIH